MNRMPLSIVLVTILLSGLGACGKSEPKPPPKVEDTVFGGLVATKERAKTDTEKAMQVNQQKLEEAMKKQDEAAAQ